MSSSSNSFTRRRALLLALGAWPFAALAAADPAFLPQGLKRWGSGTFRRFGFDIYDATLWARAEDPLRPPLALELTYRRSIAGRDIAAASLREMRKLNAAVDAQLASWEVQMRGIFPDVRADDRILGVYLRDTVRFYHNDRPAGVIDDPAFAPAFFAIWLDARSSAPELRAALLKRSAS